MFDLGQGCANVQDVYIFTTNLLIVSKSWLFFHDLQAEQAKKSKFRETEFHEFFLSF